MRKALSSKSQPSDPSWRAASRAANLRIAWLGHLIVYLCTCALLLLVAGVLPGLIVAFAWGIGLAAHGFFTVVAPVLRSRWVPPPAPRGAVAAGSSGSRTRRAAVGDGARARSLEELSAAIAHEIRSPITAAKSLVQQIAEDPTAPESVAHAQVAVQELDRVERSIAHLLRFAREEPFEPAETDLGGLIESALDLLRERAERQGVRLSVDFDPLPHVVVDAAQLRKVITNLVGNALDAHAPRASSDKWIKVAAGRNLAGDETWIRVEDNGPGMSPQVVAKIFRPFYTTKAGAGGTGLGLALARKVVERHGGSLEVESTEGKGTRFTLLLPVDARPTETTL